MPGRMGEVAGQLPLAKAPPSRVIHFGSRHARTNRRDGGPLRFQNGFIQPTSLLRGPSDVHGWCSIRTITGEYNTKTADHDPTPGNARAGGPAMDNRRARSGSQYCRKGHAFGPAATGLVLHGSRNFNFSQPGPNLLASNAEKTRAQFNRPSNAQDLGSTLHPACALDPRWRGTQTRPPF